MDNEADMVIVFASHDNESFMLLKFSQILVCQNQKLQSPIFMVYIVPNVILTKVKYNSYVIDICH